VVENGLDVVLIQYSADTVYDFLYIWKNGKDSLINPCSRCR